MSGQKDDKLLEDYLKGDSDLSRHYREDKAAGPSAEIDAAILQAARSAVEQPRRPAARNWYVPLSLAAVVVIGVSVVFRIHDFQGDKAVFESAHKQMSDGDLTTENYREPPAGPAVLSAPALESVQPVPGKDDTTGETRERMILQEQSVRREAKKAPAMRMLKKEMMAPQAATSSSGLAGDEQFADKIREGEAAVEEKRSAAAMPEESTVHEMMEPDQPAALGAVGGVVSSPPEWLAEINQLWVAGKKDEAVAGFKQFLQVWPDYPHEEIIRQLPADFELEKYLGPH